MNNVMTTYERTALICFWKRGEVLNKQKYDREKEADELALCFS